MKIRLVLMMLLVSMAFIDIFLLPSIRSQSVHASDEYRAFPDKEEQKMEVVLQLFYLDGDVVEEIASLQVSDLNEIWEDYKGWKLVEITKDRVILKKYIDDISPLLKANGYFGLTEDGTLSIFNGKPKNKNVIQSFFQIDLDKLESSAEEHLKNGIPVRSKSEYERVLKAFKPYSRTTGE